MRTQGFQWRQIAMLSITVLIVDIPTARADFLQTLANQIQSDAQAVAQRNASPPATVHVANTTTIAQPTAGTCSAAGSLSGVSVPASLQLDLNSLLSATTVTVPQSSSATAATATTSSSGLGTSSPSVLVAASSPTVASPSVLPATVSTTSSGPTMATAVASPTQRWASRGTPATQAAVPVMVPAGTRSSATSATSVPYASTVWAPAQH